MKNLIIIGAGGFGREVYHWALDSPQYKKEWVIKGFLDDDLKASQEHPLPVPVLEKLNDYTIAEDDVFVCALAKPEIKKKVVQAILGRGGRFTNLVHPSIQMGSNIHLGVGVIICPNTVLTTNIQLGDFVALNLFCAIGHDAVIADYCHLSSYSEVCGHAQLEEGAFLGTHSSVLQSLTVGAYATVGAGSVAIRNVKPGRTVIGVPAKEL